MDTIKNYLDNMFINLPVTSEVIKAKEELSQMMEDKYEELISEGKTKNEAIGIVISEFGNLDEIAEELGIKATVDSVENRKDILPMYMVKEYISKVQMKSDYISIGILLCICCVVPTILFSESAKLEVIGIAMMFVNITIAVILFILANIKSAAFKRIERGEFSLGIEAAEYVSNEKQRFTSTAKLMLSIGVALCILCVVPSIVLDCIIDNQIADILSGSSLFLMVGLGVYLITNQSNKMAGYDRLLKLNKKGSMGDKFVKDDNLTSNTIVGKILSVYWYTILCLFLIVGFLTFHWFSALGIWFWGWIGYIALKILDRQLIKMGE